MFGSEICKNGQCSNIFSTYTCFCRSGYYYDNIRFECVGKSNPSQQKITHYRTKSQLDDLIVFTVKLILFKGKFATTTVKFNQFSCSKVSFANSWPLFVLVSLDFDECQFGNTCENGACVNTAGSFNCFCSPPLVLDDSQRHCISLNSTEGAGYIQVFY